MTRAQLLEAGAIQRLIDTVSAPINLCALSPLPVAAPDTVAQPSMDPTTAATCTA